MKRIKSLTSTEEIRNGKLHFSHSDTETCSTLNLSTKNITTETF